MRHACRSLLAIGALVASPSVVRAQPSSSSAMKATVCELAEVLSERTGWLYSVDPAVACSTKIEWYVSNDSFEHYATLQMQTEGFVLVERRSGTIITERPRELDALIDEVERACPSPQRLPPITASVQRKEKAGIGWVSLVPAHVERSDSGKCMTEALAEKLDWPYPADGTEVLHFAWRKTKTVVGGVKRSPKRRKGGKGGFGKNIPGLKK